MAFPIHEASSSSSPSPSYSSCPFDSTPQWDYQVFLSFRGEDTRKGFTSHLYASLNQKGIITFKDDKELERGDVISSEIIKAIEWSVFAVIVLSPNYAFSTWCLDELQKIVECKKILGHEIIPIFYRVDPSDVRNQRRSFAEAFRKHDERFGADKEKVRRWRDSLREVANISGWDSKDWQVT
ncbi:hypothetical protein L6164_023629 [Bauhinia variegata]|uniref:Uncharacterized protein n=1 Tax=Bauhinia variegata TaxID=167791 RepID=A0ACB9MK63_BAUVA|nr:hypothetical protein L6164_023629 [Bauhinia variegata]